MKIKLGFTILIFFVSIVSSAQYTAADSLLLAERDYYYMRYRSVRDTMKINTWLNLKRVSDNLEQVVKRDRQIIEALQHRIADDSAIIASNRDVAKQYEELMANFNVVNERSKNDATMLLYLKTAAGVLIFLSLILVYSIFSISGRLRKYRHERDHYEALLEERQKQLDIMDTELRKMKQREMEFRDELEKGMQVHQERLNALQNKCSFLEKENEQLQSSIADRNLSFVPVSTETHQIQELPEDIDKLKQLVKSLYDERNSLMNLAGNLRTQVEEENRKNQDIVEKINLLAKDLTG